MSPEPDLSLVLRRLDAIQRELREGLHTMALRDEQREASYQTMIQTLTRQMVQVTCAVEVRLNAFEGRLGAVEKRLGAFEGRLGAIEERLGAIDGRLSRLETMLSDIARKLDA